MGGISFAFIYSPCITPIMSDIMGIASQRETAVEGWYLAFVYGVGINAAFGNASTSTITTKDGNENFVKKQEIIFSNYDVFGNVLGQTVNIYSSESSATPDQKQEITNTYMDPTRGLVGTSKIVIYDIDTDTKERLEEPGLIFSHPVVSGDYVVSPLSDEYWYDNGILIYNMQTGEKRRDYPADNSYGSCCLPNPHQSKP